LVKHAGGVTIRVNIYEAKTHLSRLLEQVASGERVVISKAGKPVADLVAHRGVTIEIGGLKGQLHYDDDALEEFDGDIAAMFYGTDAAS
jgi:prevent-host-death family protein